MHINIYAFAKNIAFAEEIAVYKKRLNFSLNLIALKPYQNNDAGNAKTNEAKLFVNKRRDTNNLLILLDEKGTLHDSAGFAKWFGLMSESGRNLDFLIGGAFGLDQSLCAKADHIISLSKLTFPHKLVPLLLIEQLYRAWTINSGHPYHKM
jgi:23S rRNA (pseudouridine1915-N3)-methyltransferase